MKFRLIVLSLVLLIPVIIIPGQNKRPTPSRTPAAVTPASYIGYKYVGVSYNRKLPNGVKDLGGSLLENESYGVSRMKIGGTQMLWLSRITGRNTSGVPRWLVQDVLSLPALKANQEILQGYRSLCTYNDTEDLDLIVLAEFIANKKIYQVEKAWRANTVTGKFQEVPAADVECEYDDL